MKQSRRGVYARWASIILTGTLMVSCGMLAPGTHSSNTHATEVTQHLVLSPVSGAPETPITISGTGFPAQMTVRIRMSAEHASMAIYIGEVTSDTQGQFTLLYVLPSIWPDGSALNEATLIISAVSLDDVVLAQSIFTSTAADATTQPITPSPPTSTTKTSVAPLDKIYTPTFYSSGSSGETPGSPDTSIPIQHVTTAAISSAVALTPSNPTTPPAPEPIKTSIDFLNSLLRDPSGASSLVYLSQRLRTDIDNHWALPTGLGIQPGYNSFKVVLISKGADSALVQATMTYESGASVRDFTLITEQGNWRIDRIVAGSH